MITPRTTSILFYNRKLVPKNKIPKDVIMHNLPKKENKNKDWMTTEMMEDWVNFVV